MLALPLLCLLLPSLASAGQITVEYKGTESETFVYNDTNPADYNAQSMVSWDEVTTDDTATGQIVGPPFLSISGKITVTQKGVTCTGTISAKPNPSPFLTSGMLSGTMVYVHANLPIGGPNAISDGKGNCAGNGSVPGGNGTAAQDPTALKATAPGEIFPSDQALFSASYNVPNDVDKQLAPNGMYSTVNTLSLSATLIASTTGISNGQGKIAPPPPPPGTTPPGPKLPFGPFISGGKQATRQYLPQDIKAAWAAKGLTGLLGVAAGSGLLDVANELGKATMPAIEGDALSILLSDYRIYKDPPLNDFRVLAHAVKPPTRKLPTCSHFTGRARRYCKTLLPALQSAVAADDHLASVDSALEQTVSRASAASAASDQAALNAQEANAGALTQQRGAAHGVLQTAIGKAGGLLRRARRWTLGKRRAARAIKSVEATLAARGLPQAQLKSVAGNSLTPVKVDATRALLG